MKLCIQYIDDNYIKVVILKDSDWTQDMQHEYVKFEVFDVKDIAEAQQKYPPKQWSKKYLYSDHDFIIEK